MINFRDLTYEEILSEIKSVGEPEFRAGQIFSWLHNKGVSSFDEMTNISKKLKSILAEKYYITSADIVKKLESHPDNLVVL